MTSERPEDWVDGIVRRLIHLAARRAPDTLSQRLEEEWLADLAEQNGPLARLRFAIGCSWATNVIAREHAVAALPATVAPAGNRSAIRFPHEDFPFFTGRTVTFVLVASLHVVLLYFVAIGLGQKFPRVNIPNFEAYVIEKPARSDLPTPPPPRMTDTWIKLPPTEPPSIESDPTDVITAPPHEELPPQRLVPVTPREVNRIPGGPGSGFPSSNDFYPDPSIRAGEKGVATVNACVDGKGQLTSQPTIIQSTGSTRLDEAALKLARAGSGHYRATTEDGHPVISCYPFRIRFELRN